MPALSWLRLARRQNNLVRQQELPNLEKLLDEEAARQPTYNLFVLSCAIPAGIGTFGMGSVFVAWISGNTGLPLILGTAATAILAAAAWFTFYKLYTSIPPTKKKLRDLTLKFTKKYTSFGNVFIGENQLPEAYATLLDEAAAIYQTHTASDVNTPQNIVEAMEQALSKLLETALLPDPEAQNRALSWAEPLLAELRRLHNSIQEANNTAHLPQEDPLANLRNIRQELESNQAALKELNNDLEQSLDHRP